MAEQAQGGDPVRLANDHVIMAEKLAKGLAIPAGARVLDVGFGHSGLHAAIAAGRRRAKVTALHFKEAILKHARARADVENIEDVEIVTADISNGIPVPDASFDYVLSTLGIVFIPDQEAAAKELARVLKPGGRIGLTAFTRASMPSQIYDLGGRLFPNMPRPERHHYEWADGPRAGELLSPYFHGVAVDVDSYDTCFESIQDSIRKTAGWNVNVQNMLARATPEQVEALRAGQLEIMNRVNRATNGTYMAPMDYGVITAVRRDH